MPSFLANGDGSWTLSNGLVSRTFIFEPAFGTIDFSSLSRGESLTRAIDVEGYISLDGTSYALGGIIQTGVYYHAYLNRSDTGIQVNGDGWNATSWSLGAPTAPFPWTPGTRGSPADAAWPPPGLTLSVLLAAPASAPAAHQAVSVTMHYQLCQGVPLLTQWMSVNSSAAAAAGVVITETVPVSLRLAQPYSPLSFSPYPPSTVQTDVTSFLYVQTDEPHGTGVFWQDDSADAADPGAEEAVLFTNYTTGPGVILSGGGGGGSGAFAVNTRYRPRLHNDHAGGVAEFVSFRTFLLLTDTSERERFGLSVRRLMRLWAPQVQENPIFFHATDASDAGACAIPRGELLLCGQPAPSATARPLSLCVHPPARPPARFPACAGFKLEIDQMKAVGFEMLIYSFGSGFDLENAAPAYVDSVGAQIAYAQSQGIEVGGYDLICLQRGSGGYGGNVGVQWDTVLPGGGGLGEDACFASGWVDKLTNLTDTFLGRGLSMVETDGPYGGSPCASTNHTQHLQLSDSVYQQTRTQAEWYAALRARNVYINQPDDYLFFGGQRTGLGYNEDQFNLPPWQDVTVTRMTVYDDTFRKVPSYGWVFVPLVPYHGGPDSQFEPMSAHLAEYDMALAQYLLAGVAACYRGFRLYDTPAVQAVVAKWVAVYKTFRLIINSDIIHLRRPDGQSIDAFMHANAALPQHKGLLALFNPTSAVLTQQLLVPLYYTGIGARAAFLPEGVAANRTEYVLARDFSVRLNITMPAQSSTFFVIEDAS